MARDTDMKTDESVQADGNESNEEEGLLPPLNIENFVHALAILSIAAFAVHVYYTIFAYLFGF